MKLEKDRTVFSVGKTGFAYVNGFFPLAAMAALICFNVNVKLFLQITCHEKPLKV